MVKRNCAKCVNHGLLIVVKNHKKFCKYEHCSCPKCSLVEERRSILRRQIRKKRETNKKLQSFKRNLPIMVKSIEECSSTTSFNSLNSINSDVIIEKDNLLTTPIYSPQQSIINANSNSLSSGYQIKIIQQNIRSLQLFNSYIPNECFHIDAYKLALLEAYGHNTMNAINKLKEANLKLNTGLSSNSSFYQNPYPTYNRINSNQQYLLEETHQNSQLTIEDNNYQHSYIDANAFTVDSSTFDTSNYQTNTEIDAEVPLVIDCN